MRENKIPWVEKDTPKYFKFIQAIEDNYKKPWGSSKLMAWVTILLK